MKVTRRDLGFLLPALAAAQGIAQQRKPEKLSSKVYHASRIPYEGNASKKGRQFFRGAEHSGFDLEMHETILGPDEVTHPPHKHAHEEIVIVVEGSLVTDLGGEKDTAEAGSVIFMQTNQLHNVTNAGKTPCRYYVIELRGNEA